MTIPLKLSILTWCAEGRAGCPWGGQPLRARFDPRPRPRTLTMETSNSTLPVGSVRPSGKAVDADGTIELTWLHRNT